MRSMLVSHVCGLYSRPSQERIWSVVKTCAIMSVCIRLVASPRIDGARRLTWMQDRLEVLFLAQLHHRTDGNPFCPTIHALYHFVVPSAIRTMDGLLSEVVSLKALMSFWTFISMSKNSQAEPDAIVELRKAWRWRAPRGRQPSYESELEDKDRHNVDISMHIHIYF